MATWKNAEANIRIAAASIWGKEFKSTLVHGRQIDAYAILDEKRQVAVEVTEVKSINKIQDDLNKLIHVRNANFADGYKAGDLERIMGKLISEGLLTKQRGDSGDLFVPVRSQTRRAGDMVAELSLSQDSIWTYVSAL